MKIALDATPFHHDYELLEFPRVVADLGYEFLQLTPHRDFIPFFNHPRADDDLVAKFRKACADAGVGIASVLPVLRWSGPDEDAREAAVRNWKRVIQITVDLGVNVINTEFSGRPERAEESERAFFRSIEELLPIFEREGIDVRIDPHPDDFVEGGLEALRIIRGVNSPNIGMVYVACHTFHMGADMTEIIAPPASGCGWCMSPTPWTTTAATGCATSPTRRAARPGCSSTSRSATATSVDFVLRGGRGSNPRPTDYESLFSAHATRRNGELKRPISPARQQIWQLPVQSRYAFGTATDPPGAPMLFPPHIVVIFFGHQVSGRDKLPAARIFHRGGVGSLACF